MRVCNEGFEQEFIDGKSDMYAIAFTQNVLSGRWKYFILWYLKDETRRYTDIKNSLAICPKAPSQSSLKSWKMMVLFNVMYIRKFLRELSIP